MPSEELDRIATEAARVIGGDPGEVRDMLLKMGDSEKSREFRLRMLPPVWLSWEQIEDFRRTQQGFNAHFLAEPGGLFRPQLENPREQVAETLASHFDTPPTTEKAERRDLVNLYGLVDISTWRIK